MEKTGIGIIGCGNISDIYLKNLQQTFAGTRVVACADLLPDRAKAKAEKWSVPKAVSVEELLRDPEVEIVVNLTIPVAHAEVDRKALEAGKHVHSEKPLAVTFADGSALMKLAQKRSLRLGCAPDTFMGAGIQACRALIDDGAIGAPVGAVAFMTCPGHESWHPDPEFYYKPGGGPMLDMGPYYVTALVSLLGPVRRVSGASRISFPERTIGSEPKRGTKIKVEVPTHVAGTLEFADGAIATLVMSFDVWGAHLPWIEIYGSEGSLAVPDPNTFGGPVSLLPARSKEWKSMAVTRAYSENSRGVAVADMARSIREKKPHRANADLAGHVLEILHGILEAAKGGKRYDLTTTCERPKPVPADGGGL